MLSAWLKFIKRHTTLRSKAQKAESRKAEAEGLVVEWTDGFLLLDDK